MKNEHKIIDVQMLQPSDYPALRDDMVKLYLDAFTKGDYAQHIDEVEAYGKIDKLINDGFAITASNSNKLTGFALFTSLVNDEEFPTEHKNDIDIKKSLYIAEVLVDIDYRGQGIASAIIDSALRSSAGRYSHAVIRVWENNTPALLLYQKLGFTSIATISQAKFLSKDETFEMRKIYLAKHL